MRRLSRCGAFSLRHTSTEEGVGHLIHATVQVQGAGTSKLPSARFRENGFEPVTYAVKEVRCYHLSNRFVPFAYRFHPFIPFMVSVMVVRSTTYTPRAILDGTRKDLPFVAAAYSARRLQPIIRNCLT